MAARQLPKLKTRVRFPSLAPIIQPALRRFNYWHVLWNWTRPEGSERSVSEVKGAQQNHQEHFAIGLILYGNYTFPSLAPIIQPAMRRFNYWHVFLFINKIPTLLHTLVIPTQVGIHCLYYEAWAKWHPAGAYETIKTIDSRTRREWRCFFQWMAFINLEIISFIVTPWPDHGAQVDANL